MLRWGISPGANLLLTIYDIALFLMSSVSLFLINVLLYSTCCIKLSIFTCNLSRAQRTIGLSSVFKGTHSPAIFEQPFLSICFCLCNFTKYFTMLEPNSKRSFYFVLFVCLFVHLSIYLEEQLKKIHIEVIGDMVIRSILKGNYFEAVRHRYTEKLKTTAVVPALYLFKLMYF